ncbi:transglutaminase domain-containing protein [Candidatus Omnitrophus magneticus]|uniref:Transglutaminase domain-containing protein n=1 Tax=Candidatus Omnitrophus magneticus TaxID=1609969 RepID=A0A0F0CR84_9BACT|nr:transglutaminase domain-containing protein [Candidatus Omnitrophus magneticus]
MFYFFAAGLFSYAEDLNSGNEDILKKKTENIYNEKIDTDIVRCIKLPDGYHEGLFKEGNKIFINNGENGDTWVLDIDSEKILTFIKSCGTFTEGLTKDSKGRYWVSDWDDLKLYRVSIENNKMKPEFEVSFAPLHPAGVAATDGKIYMLTWKRGIGTEYHLFSLDEEGKILSKIKILGIYEPSQLAWDGKNLWISSWYSRRIYKVDINNLEILGYIVSPVSDTTGIVCDGEFLWVTGTKSDLYQLKIKRKII